MTISAFRNTSTTMVAAGLAFFLWNASPISAHAQDSEPSEFEVRAQGRSVSDVLLELRDRYSVPLAWDPLLVSGKRVFCVSRNADFNAVLRCVLNGTGLVYEIQQTGTYTIRRATIGAPRYGHLLGLVVDTESGQPVPHAEVKLFASTDSRGRIANGDGIFQFEELLPGSYLMRVHHLGYAVRDSLIAIAPGGDERTVVHLDAMVSPMDLAIVDGMAVKPSSRLGLSIADQEELVSNMDLGTLAVLRSIDAMPGVRVNDANADVHIQGGGTGELQYRLDGAPVFMPLNVAAFIGPFSPFALNSITVHKAGFNVSQGSQISGIISAEHDLSQPNPEGTEGGRNRFVVQVDPLSTNARYNAHWGERYGPDGTFMTAARIGTWNWGAPGSLQSLLANWNSIDTFLLSAFAEQNTPFADLPPTGDATVQFFDWHNALKIRFDGFKSLSISSYWGSSSLGNDLSASGLLDPANDPGLSAPLSIRNDLATYRDIYSWNSGATQATYSTVVNNRVTGNVKARASYYRLSHDFVAPDSIALTTSEDDGNRIFESALEGKLHINPGQGHFLEVGTELVLTSSKFVVAGTQLIPLAYASTEPRLSSYVQDRLELGTNTVLEGGARITYVTARGSFYPEPRLSARFDWKNTSLGDVALYLGSGIYRQFVSQFDISSRSPRTFVRSTRFWMATDESVEPAKAGHLAAELMVSPSADWTFRLEAHYKKLYHLLTLDYSAQIEAESPEVTQPLVQSEFLNSTKGRAYGFAVVADRAVGVGKVSLRYDYSQSERQITNLFGDKMTSVPWNEPHRIEAAFDIVPIPHMVFSTRWKSIFGRTWGFRQAYYDFLGAHHNDIDVLLSELKENGVSPDAAARIERHIEIHDLTNPDGHGLPALHQLDFTLAYTFPFRKFGIQLRADMVNVLNANNVSEWRFRMDEETFWGSGSVGGTGLLDKTERPLLPRVFTLAAKVTW